jgi:hypothetical protein
MHLPSYAVVERADDYSEFKFISNGPNGDIVKLVIFEKYPLVDFYNLALVDVVISNPRVISDSTLSNNNDLRKILATVVKILTEYTTLFPDRTIFFQGSDDAGRRTTLYKRAIAAYYNELEKEFDIEGITNLNVRESFNPKGKYEAFLVRRK